MVKAVLFDLDGTLIDSERKLLVDLNATFAQMGEIYDAYVYEDWVDVLMEKKRQRIIKEQQRDLTKEEEQEIRIQFWAAYEKNVMPWIKAIKQGIVTIYPETIEVLETLQNQGYKLLVVSRSAYEPTVQKINALGLNKYFPRQYVVDVRAPTKTRGYLESLSQEALEAGFQVAALAARDVTHLFVVGDRPEDMFAGAALRRWAAKQSALQNMRVINIFVNRKMKFKSKHADVEVRDLREALVSVQNTP